MINKTTLRAFLQKTVIILQVSSFIWEVLARFELYVPIGIAVEASLKFTLTAVL